MYPANAPGRVEALAICHGAKQISDKADTTMQTVIVIFKQLITMAIYCGIGYVLHRTKLITQEGCRSFSKVLLYVILPCVIVHAFLQEAGGITLVTLTICTGMSALLLLLSMLVSRLLLHKNPMEQFAASFSNAGFIGVSLVSMALGAEAVVYVAPFIALLNIFQWIYGQCFLLGKRHVGAKQAVMNPLVIAFLAGIVCFALPFELPQQLKTTIASLAACNSPLAMIVIGYYLAEIPLKELFLSKGGWRVSAVRLCAVPVLSVLLIAWIPGLDGVAKTALAIVASAPVAINTAIYAELFGEDYKKAVVMICQSSMLCPICMPLLGLLAETLIAA